MKIAVLFDDVEGRPDATPDERGVLEAVEGALSAFHSLGHHPVAVPAGPDPFSWAVTLEELSPEVILNLCEGLGGRSDGEILATRTVETLGLPFTGSPSATLDLARRKDRVNTLLEARGLPVPPWALWEGHGVGGSGPGGVASRGRAAPSRTHQVPARWTSFPAIVKPAAEDGSVGITQESVVSGTRELALRLAAAASFGSLLVQAFVGSREINVGIVGRQILPLSEIVFRNLPPAYHPLVGYEAKWAPGSREDRATRPVCPAPLAAEVASKARALAMEAWTAVGGRGYGRVDLRLTEPDTLHILEVNPNPDLAPSAGLARMAAAAGWSYEELLERILAEALAARPAEALAARPAEALAVSSAGSLADPPGRAAADPPAKTAADSPARAAADPPGTNPPDTDMVLSPLESRHRGAVEALLRATEVFREDEILVALEVLDSYLARPGQDYHAVGAFTPGGKLLGYVVYGPTPCTLGTWDLYWIAVSTAAQGTGVGTVLLKEVEGRLIRSRARQLIIETSSRPPYDPTRAFYLRRGFRELARLPDFYEVGDDKVIYAKSITVRPEEG